MMNKVRVRVPHPFRWLKYFFKAMLSMPLGVGGERTGADGKYGDNYDEDMDPDWDGDWDDEYTKLDVNGMEI